MAASASAETLAYNSGPTHVSTPDNPSSANPYLQRRNHVRAERAEKLTAPIPDMATVASAEPKPSPLKVTIPNIHLARQAEPPITAAASAAPSVAPGAPPSLADTLAEKVMPAGAVSSFNAMVDAAKASAAEPVASASAPLPPLPPLPPSEGESGKKIKIARYQSPGAIIHRKTLHMATPQPEMAVAAPPEGIAKMAQLAPAAGGDAAAPAITPLIDTPALPAAGSNQKVPAPLPAAALPAPSSPAPPPKDLLPPLPPPGEAISPAPASIKAVEETLQPLLATPPPPEPAPIEPSLETTAKKSTAKIASQKSSHAPDEAMESSEPAGDLSPASKAILKHIPSHLAKKKHSRPKPVSIERAKEVKELNPGEDGTETVKHESMGIKIEVKRPRFNADYDLDRAYDALSTGHSADAIAIYKNILENDPKNTGALFGLATLYHRAGQIDLARPLYAKLLAIDPNNRDGLNNFLVLLADESPQAAIPQLEKLEAKNPDFSPIPAQLAVVYEKMGNVDKATEKMLRAVTLAPENLTYRFNLAIILDKQGKYEEAAKLYGQLLEAWRRGETIPGDPQKIQQRLTFISFNRP